jgi:hypothetical protein
VGCLKDGEALTKVITAGVRDARLVFPAVRVAGARQKIATLPVLPTARVAFNVLAAVSAGATAEHGVIAVARPGLSRTDVLVHLPERSSVGFTVLGSMVDAILADGLNSLVGESPNDVPLLGKAGGEEGKQDGHGLDEHLPWLVLFAWHCVCCCEVARV